MEKGGGAWDRKAVEEVSDGKRGNSVYGGSGSASQGATEERKEILSDTDEPSLDSRVVDNLTVIWAIYVKVGCVGFLE